MVIVIVVINTGDNDERYSGAPDRKWTLDNVRSWCQDRVNWRSDNTIVSFIDSAQLRYNVMWLPDVQSVPDPNLRKFCIVLLEPDQHMI